MNDDILTTEQVADLLQCKPKRVDELRREGKLPASKLGRSPVFVRSLVVEAVRRMTLDEMGAPLPPGKVELERPGRFPLPRRRRSGSVNPSIDDLPPLPGAN